VCASSGPSASGKPKDFDPFLLLDDFRNERPRTTSRASHGTPHRGIETITYVLAGSVEHGDSLGNKGKMTAGRRAVDDRRLRHSPPGDA